MTPELELINTKKLAEILGKSESTARELMMSKDFPSIMINHRYYVRQSSLIDWLQKLERNKI